MDISSLGSKFKQTTNDLSQKVNSSLKSVVGEKIPELLALTPELEKCGYHISDLQIEFAITPAIIIVFTRPGKSALGISTLLKSETPYTSLQKGLLSALEKTEGMVDVLEKYGRRLSEIEIEFALSPKIKIHTAKI